MRGFFIVKQLVSRAYVFKKSVEAEAKNAIRFMRELSKKDMQY